MRQQQQRRRQLQRQWQSRVSTLHPPPHTHCRFHRPPPSLTTNTTILRSYALLVLALALALLRAHAAAKASKAASKKLLKQIHWVGGREAAHAAHAAKGIPLEAGLAILVIDGTLVVIRQHLPPLEQQRQRQQQRQQAGIKTACVTHHVCVCV